MGGDAAALAAPVLHRPGLDVAIGSALIAVLLIAGTWWAVGQALTLAHEGGHALVSVLLGTDVQDVRVWRNREGLTTTAGADRVTRVITGMAGYLAPPAFGLAAVVLIVLGYAVAVLWITVVLLVLVLTVAGTWFTRFAIVMTGLAFGLLLGTESDGLLLWAACVWAWILLLGGLVHAIQHFGVGGDHHNLRELTWIPVWIWSLLFTAVAAATLACAVAWMTGISDPPTAP